MPRKKRTQEEVIQKSEEALATPINPSGLGEDPVVRDLVQGGIRQATDTEALDMALALRQIIRGQEMTLEQLRRQEEEIAKLKAEAAARDEAARKYNEDQQKFLTEIMDRAEKLRVRGDELDKMKANASQETQQAYQKALAQAKLDRIRFEEDLARMKKVTVISPGILQIQQVNGKQVSRIVPEEIRIKHRGWVLQPGVPTEVPEVVAQALESRRQGQQQTERLEHVLQSDLEAGELDRRMRDIRKDEVPYDPSKAPLSN